MPADDFEGIRPVLPDRPLTGAMGALVRGLQWAPMAVHSIIAEDLFARSIEEPGSLRAACEALLEYLRQPPLESIASGDPFAMSDVESATRRTIAGLVLKQHDLASGRLKLSDLSFKGVTFGANTHIRSAQFLAPGAFDGAVFPGNITFEYCVFGTARSDIAGFDHGFSRQVRPMLANAAIQGDLTLRWCRMYQPVGFHGARAGGSIRIERATAAGFDLSNTTADTIELLACTVEGDVMVDNPSVASSITVDYTTVDGTLTFRAINISGAIDIYASVMGTMLLSGVLTHAIFCVVDSHCNNLVFWWSRFNDGVSLERTVAARFVAVHVHTRSLNVSDTTVATWADPSYEPNFDLSRLWTIDDFSVEEVPIGELLWTSSEQPQPIQGPSEPMFLTIGAPDLEGEP